MLIDDYEKLSKNPSQKKELFALLNDASLERFTSLFDASVFFTLFFGYGYPPLALFYFVSVNALDVGENVLTTLMGYVGAFWFVWLILYFFLLYPLTLFFINQKLKKLIQERLEQDDLLTQLLYEE